MRGAARLRQPDYETSERRAPSRADRKVTGLGGRCEHGYVVQRNISMVGVLSLRSLEV